MISLSEYLNQKFTSSILWFVSASWLFLVMVTMLLGLINTKASLKDEIEKSSIVVSSFIYEKNWKLINEHFDYQASSQNYSYVKLETKGDRRIIYESNFNHLSFAPEFCYVDDSSEIIITKACSPAVSLKTIVLITAFVLSYFAFLIIAFFHVKEKVLVQISRISLELADSIEEDHIDSSTKTEILEIDNIKQVIRKKTGELKKSVEQEAQIQLSKRLSHDLRSPLAVLISLSRKKQFQDEDKVLLNGASKTLKEISNTFLQNSMGKHHSLPRKQRFDLNQEINQLIRMKYEEYRSRLSTDSIQILVPDFTCIWINRVELLRVISNLLNNSIESSLTPFIELSVSIDKDFILSVHDNGPGFSADIISDFSKDKIKTSKTTGFGLGLGTAKEVVLSMGGEINIYNRINGGAGVDLIFPLNIIMSKDTPIVLIDDDKFIRLSWATSSKEVGLNCLTYPKFDDFVRESSSIDRSAEIFIDSNLGDNFKGEFLVEEIMNLGFSRINLETGSDESEIIEIKYLNNIISKNFPYSFS